jgi:hypothetical protein
VYGYQPRNAAYDHGIYGLMASYPSTTLSEIPSTTGLVKALESTRRTILARLLTTLSWFKTACDSTIVAHFWYEIWTTEPRQLTCPLFVVDVMQK